MDKYDKAVAYLTEHPDRIIVAWGVPARGDHPDDVQAHCLFQYVTPDGRPKAGGGCGCLTQIRETKGEMHAATAKLTAAILADNRLPNGPSITVEDLPVFAEWQRRIDKELNRH